MAIFWGYGDLLHSQSDELSLNKHMGWTIYTKGRLYLLLCVNYPDGMHNEVEKPVPGHNSIFVVIAPLHLPNPISVLNIMCALHRYR
jgi:hypothetical protein